MSYITDDPNYSIATGDTEFGKMQLDGDKIMILATIEDLDAADASLELHQSVDGENWGFIPYSKVTMSIAQPSVQWNVQGLLEGAFVRLALKKGSATAGIVKAIKMLSNG